MYIHKSELPEGVSEKLDKGTKVSFKVKKVHPDHVELDGNSMEPVEQSDLDKQPGEGPAGKNPEGEAPDKVSEQKPKVRRSKDSTFGKMEVNQMRDALQQSSSTSNPAEPELY
jgi:hypothetical protein